MRNNSIKMPEIENSIAEMEAVRLSSNEMIYKVEKSFDYINRRVFEFDRGRLVFPRM